MTKKEQKELRKLISNWTVAKQSAQVDLNGSTGADARALDSEVQTYEVCISQLDVLIRGFHLT